MINSYQCCEKDLKAQISRMWLLDSLTSKEIPQRFNWKLVSVQISELYDYRLLAHKHIQVTTTMVNTVFNRTACTIKRGLFDKKDWRGRVYIQFLK